MQCQNTMINCIQHELPMPQDLIDLRRMLISMLGGPSKVPRYEICTPIYKILQLKYDINQGIATDIDEMLAKFNEAEDDFERIISLFPEECQYRKFHLKQQQQQQLPGFFDSACHIYPSISVATMWNGLRACRLLILGTMLEELHKRFLHVPVHMVPARYQIECRKAKSKMERIALAILASVPQHFRLVSDNTLDMLAPVTSAEDLWPHILDNDCEAWLGDSESSDSGDSDDEGYYSRRPSLSNPMTARDSDARAERFMLLASVTNGLVCPLYFVGMSTSSTAIRAFVVDRLHAIHSETGLGQAKKLADFVAGHERPSEVWQAKDTGLMNFRGWNSQLDQRQTAMPV